MGNMAAVFAFRLNGSHLGRFAVAAMFLLSFLVSGAWGACVSGVYDTPDAAINKGMECGPSRPSKVCTDCSDNSCEGVFSSQGYYFVGGTWVKTRNDNYCEQWCGNCGFTGWGTCRYTIRCSTQSEADSVACVNGGGSWLDTPNGKTCINCSEEQSTCTSTGGLWVEDATAPCGYSCSHCDAQCQCEEAGGTWVASNGGYCVPKCESQFCCDSLNQTLPPQIDTTWQGCVATDPSNDKCVVLPTVANNTGSTSAECTAKSRYLICTSSYVWNRTANQCAPISTNNCINQDVANDPRCTKVLCEAYQTRSVSALQYNGRTECYEGLQLVQDMMVCDNGIREERSRSTEAFQVCDSYLEANNITIQDYLSGQNGGYASVGGNSAGPGGGSVGTGGGSTSEGGCVGNGCNTGLFDGGTSVNAQGDTVQNSASPNIGGVWTPQQQLVTQVDSATGIVTVVQNSQGGDSVRTSVTPSGVRCIGISGGVATLSNGYSTWTCSNVQSCSQAVISASINGGRCSAGSNGIVTDNYNSDRMPLILDSNGNAILTSESDNLERAMNTLTAILNANHKHDSLQRADLSSRDRRQRDSISRSRDSLWRKTFGDNLDAVRNLEGIINSASSVNSQAIAQASSANSNAVGSAASKVSTAIGNASADISGAIGNLRGSVNSASSANSQAIASATSQLVSANSQGFGGVISAVENSRSANSQALNSIASMFRDSVHRTNENVIGIYNALDTNGIIQKDLNKINSSIGGVASSVDSAFRISMNEWYNDKLKVTMDSNVTRIVDALDALQVDVKLDSIKIDMPKDSLLDSIHADLSKFTSGINPQVSNDTMDFGAMYAQGYNANLGDTSIVYDSSLAAEITSRQWINGNSYTDSGFVDSVEATLPGKLDSTGRMYNARSDSMTAAYADTLNKYSGLDSTGRALNELFASQNNSCSCFDVNVTYTALGANYTTHIAFSKYLCDLKLFGELSAIGLMRVVLRLFTSILCVFLLIRAIGQRDGKK